MRKRPEFIVPRRLSSFKETINVPSSQWRPNGPLLKIPVSVPAVSLFNSFSIPCMKRKDRTEKDLYPMTNLQETIGSIKSPGGRYGMHIVNVRASNIWTLKDNVESPPLLCITMNRYF